MCTIFFDVLCNDFSNKNNEFLFTSGTECEVRAPTFHKVLSAQSVYKKPETRRESNPHPLYYVQVLETCEVEPEGGRTALPAVPEIKILTMDISITNRFRRVRMIQGVACSYPLPNPNIDRHNGKFNQENAIIRKQTRKSYFFLNPMQ